MSLSLLKQITFKVIAISIIAMIFSGCSYKQDDHIVITTAKTAVNAPVLIFVGTGAVINTVFTTASMIIVATPFKTYEYTSKYFKEITTDTTNTIENIKIEEKN